MSKLINVSESNFEELQKTNSYYVDKTEFLYKLLRKKTRSKVALLTIPRRFGKTLMLSMMENFFDITTASRAVFDGLNILKHHEICEEYMNQYTVIFLSFMDIIFTIIICIVHGM